jgi:hypothetical protein
VPVPDVTVITPVHNTDQYLDRWFRSLLEQTIGTDRIQVVAVDDGSTDGSGAALERLAALHPGLLALVRLAERGGPARARNRALARLTAHADRERADVVVARVVGVDGRWVPEDAYRRTAADVPFPSWALVRTLTPSKLFRRQLIEDHALRFREELPAYSDGPFFLEAYYRARRISTRADYDYYYLVTRADRSNITHSAPPAHKLRGIAAAVEVTARFSEPGPERDLVNTRHLGEDLANLFREEFLGLGRPAQQQLFAEAGALLEGALTEGLLRNCGYEQRLRLHCIARGSLDGMLSLLRFRARHGRMPDPLAAAGATWSADRRTLTLTAHRAPELDPVSGVPTARAVRDRSGALVYRAAADPRSAPGTYRPDQAPPGPRSAPATDPSGPGSVAEVTRTRSTRRASIAAIVSV